MPFQSYLFISFVAATWHVAYGELLIVMMLSSSTNAGYLSVDKVLIVSIIASETFAVKPLIRAKWSVRASVQLAAAAGYSYNIDG